MNRDVLSRNNVRVFGRGSQPMLFAHGFGCDQNMWRFVTPAFEDDFRIILFDYVGSGKSDLRAYDPKRYVTLDGYASDVLEICEALELSDIVFVGHSVSSMIGMLAANEQPERFARLIMIGPSPCYVNDGDYIGGFDRADIVGLLDTMERNYIGWAQFLAPAVMKNDERPELTRELEASFCSTDPEIARRFAEATFFADNRADLPKVRVPSLLLQCSDDAIAPASVGEYLQRNLPGSTLRMMQATGHCPHMSHPEETIQAMQEYLAGAGALEAGSGAPVMSGLLDTAPCGFLSFGDDGTVLAVNATLLRMLGCERADVVGQHFQGLLAAGGRIFYQTHFFPLLKLHGEVEEIFLSLRAKSGEEIPVLVNARRSEREGRMVNDCVFVRMRQRAHFEDELLKARNAAQKANKAKDDFLAALSHELRTPLNPVLMLSTAMEMDPALSDDVREQAGTIRRNAELEARLIDDLLDLTRITHGKLKLVPSVVDLHVLLGQTEEIVKSEGRAKRVAVSFSKEAVEHHLSGDSARLQQVFWNLAKNAIKFTPAGGEVRIATSNPASGRLAVSVSDTGIGIDPSALSRIFEAFDQGHVSTQQFGGLGLGLAITRAIVEMHGGTIRAESAGKGRGATFTVGLATCPAPAANTAPLPAPAAAGTRALRLLLVEDHESTRDVLARILRRAGYEVHAAGTGEEALQIAASTDGLDVVISDLGLPDQSGFDLMRTLRAKHHLPGIALSGYGMEEDLKKARAAGFVAHLVKPVSFEQLRELLEQVASGKLA